MVKEGRACLTAAVVMIIAGLLVLALTLESYAVPSSCFLGLSSVFGGTVAVDGDGLLALSMLLFFQGFSLFDSSRRSLPGLLFKLWLFVPFFLVLAMLSSKSQGSLLLFLSGLTGGRDNLLVPSLVSVALTVVFAFLASRPQRAGDAVKETVEAQDAEAAVVPQVVPPAESPASPEVTEDAASGPCQEALDGREEEVTETLARILRLNGKDDGTYRSLQRKRKEVLKLSKEERKRVSRKYCLYKAEDGRTGRIAEILKALRPYTFAVSFDLVNSKGLKKTLSYECVVVPAFSEEEAEELAMKEIKAYSKGGYVYTKIRNPLSPAGLKQGLAYDDFLMPWASESLCYSGDDTLFVWDFLLKYSKDRRLDLIASGVRPRGSQRFDPAPSGVE